MGKRITLTEAAERARKALEDAEQRRREFNISEAREMACSECEDLEREVAQLKWQLRQGKTFFFYNIGYTTCEESCTIHCIHEEVFSEDKLFQIVEDCVYDSLVEHKNPGGANFEDIVHKHGPSGYSPFVKALESRGFTVPRPAKEAFVFGWASCTDPNDWSGHTYDRHKQMQANLARRLGIAKKADNGE